MLDGLTQWMFLRTLAWYNLLIGKTHISVYIFFCVCVFSFDCFSSVYLCSYTDPWSLPGTF